MPTAMPLPAVWTESKENGCNLERLWSHTLDGLADLTEAELTACEAGCQRNDGATKAVLLLDDACIRLPEVCEDATALRAQYRADHEPAKPDGKDPPAPIP